jgi:UDP-glucose 4-epimerase
MSILVTGGAGYIGSVTVAHLLDRGHAVRVLDDLSTGHRRAVPEGAELVIGRVQDLPNRTEVLEDIEAVVHFASMSLVGESVREPLSYFRENVGAAVALLEAMEICAVRGIVFSSSAAVYGEPSVDVIDESQPIEPVNPYGHSKAMIERILIEEARAKGLSVMSLRYFNACGADGPRGEHHDPETHLIPRLCTHVLGRLEEFSVHGQDHPTPDGTPIRDYVHVRDLARAHAAALEHLAPSGFEAINLGTGEGASVLEVLRSAERLCGRRLSVPIGPRRPGDPARLVATRDRAARRLRWQPHESSLDQILGDALLWHEQHPAGYPE